MVAYSIYIIAYMLVTIYMELEHNQSCHYFTVPAETS
jgi:hypothetical protein